MDRIKRNKSVKLLKLSSIFGYISVLLLMTYITFYAISQFNNINLIIFKGENLPFIIFFSLMLLSFIFGFIIPITIYQDISTYRKTLYDNRDNNKLVTGIKYVKNGNIQKAFDICNTMNSPKRKSFLLGVITGFNFNSQYEEQKEDALNGLNQFQYR